MKTADKVMKWIEKKYDAFWKWLWEGYDFSTKMALFIPLVIFIFVGFRLALLAVVGSLFFWQI